MRVITMMVVMAKHGAGARLVTMTCTRIWKHPANTTGSGGIQHVLRVERLETFTTLV